MKSTHENRVIIVLGPTGVGKTGASILLAKKLKTEIISADSMQIYRHMDIGTAKPSREDLRAVRHHLLDIISPNDSFSAGLFRKEAERIIDDLHRGGRIPLVVGGTGLYIRTLTRGLFEGPPADWSLRETLMMEERTKGKGHLHHVLRSIDPESAHNIEPNDVRRTIRALEVALNEKRVMSDLQRSSTEALPCDFIKVGLSRSRKELYQSINERVGQMMERGLLREVEDVLKMKPGRTPLQALGYKEMKAYLDGESTIEEAVDLVKKRTRQYAKRQMTWFRKEPGIDWVDVTGLTDSEEVFEKIVNSIENIRNII